ncbi:glycosyltransferase family 2 protein [Flavobacterium hiemivividum]|uniref:Glycosyltransferase n=1 Tax=Flavobacterium hiemivividum TaxID=2541734 RepID=A0A4R5CV38_9FLAO|nr:glycosyltransferase [Flavobacterium hiemivividum]TDE04579.1 glycosyltransferase [Flavobacterium hiemivividum]
MISIIIPFYKFTFFEETLQSLVNQTDKRFKVYIGDDASPENPAALLDKYNGQLDLIYQRFETNLGGISLVQQWDRCIALSADEEWLMILGDDDVLSSHCIEEFYKNQEEIKKNNCNVIRFATIEIDGDSKIISKEYTHPKLEKATDSLYRKFFKKSRGSLSEQIFKRKAYDKHGFFNYGLAWYADDRAWLEFSESHSIYTINSAVVNFRISNENISRGGYKQKEKQDVKFQFFNFLIFSFLEKFDKEQKKYFLLEYELMVYKIRKATFRFWFSLFLLILKNINLTQAIKFSRRYLIHLNKNATTT